MRGGWLLLLTTLMVAGCSSASVHKGEPDPQTSVGMDKEAIRAVIRENLIPIRHCYEKELKAKRNLYGKLILEWDIEDTGKVSRVEVKKAFDANVDSCLADVIKNAKFPAAPKGSVGRVSFPFMFTDK